MLVTPMNRKAAVAIVCVLLLTAVGCDNSPSLPPDQVIAKAGEAIKLVNSFQFVYDAGKPQAPVPGLFITRAAGGVARPDKLVGDLNITAGGIPLNVKVVIDGKNQYWTDPVSGKWSALPDDFNVSQYFDPAKVEADILGSIKNPSSDGTENVDGTDCYRIKGRVPASSLKSLSPQVNATSDLTTTLSIGSSDFLLRKVIMQGPIMDGEPADIVRNITFSEYNKEVKVETPVLAK